MSTQLEQTLNELMTQFTMTPQMVQEIAAAFRDEMRDGLSGNSSSLKMLPAFMVKPTGREKGTYLAIDFGGTNIRLMLIELRGRGDYNVVKFESFPLKDLRGGYDFTLSIASGIDLFDHIAERINMFVDHENTYYLGHTFSFPSHNTGTNEACLICWTKEINTRGVEGRDVNQMLSESLRRKQVHHVVPVAILNDTVASLLAVAYRDNQCDLGSICGTGHNTCYLESHSFNQEPMLVNIESGNFDVLPYSPYDLQLDAKSNCPGRQRLEKMVGGCYLGEIVRLVIVDLAEKGALFSGSGPGILLNQDFVIGAECLSMLLADDSEDLTAIKIWCQRQLAMEDTNREDRKALQIISKLVVRRAASLIAATFIGIISHIDGTIPKAHTIAIDGSIYEKLPDFNKTMSSVLREGLPDRANGIKLVSVKDASGIGAAVAAAMCVPQFKRQ